MKLPQSLRRLCPGCHHEVGPPAPDAEGDQYISLEMMRANHTPCKNTSCPVYIEWQDDYEAEGEVQRDVLGLGQGALQEERPGRVVSTIPT